LENALHRALLLAREHPISLAVIQEACARTRLKAPTDQTITGYVSQLLSKAQQGSVQNVRREMLEEMDRLLFAQAMQQAGGNKAKAARSLGVSRTTMRSKVFHFGLVPHEPKNA